MPGSNAVSARCDSPHFDAYTDYALDAISEQLGCQPIDEDVMTSVIADTYAAIRAAQNELDVHMYAIKRRIDSVVIGVLTDKTVIPF